MDIRKQLTRLSCSEWVAQRVERHWQDILWLAGRYNAFDVRVMPVLAGRAASLGFDPDTTLHILVKFSRGTGALSWAGLEERLTTLLSCKVCVWDDRVLSTEELDIYRLAGDFGPGPGLDIRQPDFDGRGENLCWI